MSRFVYVWQYRVRPDAVEPFTAAYGPDGDWARLFRRDPGYLGTALLRDRDDALRFWTIDSWRSAADRARFLATNASEFTALDERCAAWTQSETHLGDFDEADG